MNPRRETEGRTVEESPVVNEWIAEGEGRMLLELAAERFGPALGCSEVGIDRERGSSRIGFACGVGCWCFSVAPLTRRVCEDGRPGDLSPTVVGERLSRLPISSTLRSVQPGQPLPQSLLGERSPKTASGSRGG